MKIQQKFTFVAHPQVNRPVEVTNCTLLHGLKARLDKAKGDWMENLSNVPWATTLTMYTGETPCCFIYGMEEVIDL